MIICTHRRFELLKLAVESLTFQTASSDLFEVIIVDNDTHTNNEVKSIIKKASEKINIRYIFEPVLGLSQARNTGGKAAKANYIGYMDDDAKAPANYISKAIELINVRKPDILGGPYIPFYLSNKSKWYKDEYGSSANIKFSGYFNKNKTLSGTNMIYKKEILIKTNWFNKEFGMSGSKLAFGEETMVQIEAWSIKPNMLVWHDSDLYVKHFVPSHKMKIISIIKRRYKIGKSQAYMWENNKSIKNYKILINIFYIIFLMIFKGIPKIFIRDSKIYPYWQNYFYEKYSKYFTALGKDIRYIKDSLYSK